MWQSCSGTGHPPLPQVRIFYNAKQTMEVEEVPKYEGFDSVLSSVGGAISLYLGMSFASILEVVEFLIRLAETTVQKH